MAPIRAVYSGSAAEFVIAQGAEADILDELGGVIGTGATAMLPLTASVYNVRKNDRATPVTDLLDYTGAAITQVTSVTSPYEERARLLWFRGPSVEIPETLWLTPAAGDFADVVFYALHPHVEHVVNYIDGAVGRASIGDHNDVDLTGAADGEVLTVTGGVWGPGAGGAGVSDHGSLTGLTDDDHPQYLTQARGDIRYLQLGGSISIAQVTSLGATLTTKSDVGHTHSADATTSGLFSIARMPAGSTITVFESAGAYSRPTTRTDVCVVFTGEVDPGTVALATDKWDRKVITA